MKAVHTPFLMTLVAIVANHVVLGRPNEEGSTKVSLGDATGATEVRKYRSNMGKMHQTLVEPTQNPVAQFASFMHGHSRSDYAEYYSTTSFPVMEDFPEDAMSRPDPEGIIERAITPVIKEWTQYVQASQARFHSATYYLKDLYKKSGVSTIDNIERSLYADLDEEDRIANLRRAYNMFFTKKHKTFVYDNFPLLKVYVDESVRYQDLLYVHGFYANDLIFHMIAEKLGFVYREKLITTEDFDEVLAHYQPLFRAIYIYKYLGEQSASDGRFLKLTPGEADEGDYFEPEEEEAQLDSDGADGEQPFEEDSSKRLAVAMAALARKEATEKQLTTEEVGPKQALHLENMELDDPSDPYYGASTHSKFDYVRDVPELASSGPAIDTRPGTGQWPVDPPRTEGDDESPEDGEEEEEAKSGEATDESDDYWVAAAPDDDQVPADIQALVDRDIKYTNRMYATLNRIYRAIHKDVGDFTEDPVLAVVDAWAEYLAEALDPCIADMEGACRLQV
ncbi:hypothetical protein IWQ60_007003 [Tieghemiomyces parasiticus]|uniref:Uncharacterized protein n=1 Tax=Tieghemiomyces parasiticus TaxID=78921 RepID=A0A9W8A6Y0_9FUNG|nr:hypothetical protein IWQ60_007003 [Tieghemiomyces parasiticus]